MKIRSHSDIRPLAACARGAAFFATSLLLFTVAVSHAQSETQVRPLYEGVGSNYSTPLEDPMGIYFDRVKNEVYVADTGNGMVVIFNESGMPVYRFRHDVRNARGRLVRGEPMSTVVDEKGTIYLVDSQAPYVDVLDQRGRSQGHIEVPADNCGQPERFTLLAIDDKQTVYAVTGCKAPRVAVIEDGETVARMITLHDPEADRSCITGFAVGADGRFYLTDACAPRMVQIYGPDGALAMAFGKHDTGYDNFAFPAGIAVSPDGGMWIADSIRQVVSHFDHEGKLLTMIGGKGTQPGSFEYPSAVATDGASRLFVLERQGRRYQCLQVQEGVAATKN
jgi:sugar lactone lactonase YvrE